MSHGVLLPIAYVCVLGAVLMGYFVVVPRRGQQRPFRTPGFIAVVLGAIGILAAVANLVNGATS